MNNKIIFWVIFAIIVVAVIYVGLISFGPGPVGKYDTFAKCLSDKKLTMYGAYWCPHCQNQKKEFGTSFDYVPYVECTQQVDACKAAGVVGYPTWIDASGKKYEGEQKLEKLAEISGCTLQEDTAK